ncbi:hypothetical protein WN55_04805 [Dufourea novaeangliae]|uniref:Transposable element Tc3 transposase n=1 Tax=Dufourea novaeangliae TaxID=178035 RepID=A0A154PLF9_DUFNO|nr:hypothetical protein WN55_04805 [Dufourea novaeangliae]
MRDSGRAAGLDRKQRSTGRETRRTGVQKEGGPLAERGEQQQVRRAPSPPHGTSNTPTRCRWILTLLAAAGRSRSPNKPKDESKYWRAEKEMLEVVTVSTISRSSVLRILVRHKFHPYHITLYEELYGTDFMNRVAFCQWALNKIQFDETFFSSILFTDEATFTNHGNLNLHNMHYWSIDNPHRLRQVEHQRQWSVNVWCGIVGDQLIGQHFIDGNLTGERYAHFTRSRLGTLLENVPLNVRQMIWVQHDGCPAYYARSVRDALNELYPNEWIGRGELVPWPPGPPDLPPLDFFLWGALTNAVYREVPTTPENMK